MMFDKNGEEKEEKAEEEEDDEEDRKEQWANFLVEELARHSKSHTVTLSLFGCTSTGLTRHMFPWFAISHSDTWSPLEMSWLVLVQLGTSNSCLRGGILS